MFETTDPVPVGVPGEGQVLNLQLHGRLMLHGITKPVVVDIQTRRSSDIVDVVGATRITLADFNIPTPIIPGFVSTDDTGLMEFALVLRRT